MKFVCTQFLKIAHLLRAPSIVPIVIEVIVTIVIIVIVVVVVVVVPIVEVVVIITFFFLSLVCSFHCAATLETGSKPSTRVRKRCEVIVKPDYLM